MFHFKELRDAEVFKYIESLSCKAISGLPSGPYFAIQQETSAELNYVHLRKASLELQKRASYTRIYSSKLERERGIGSTETNGLWNS
ncbi:hypothetical protein TNCT_362271 [Trichonephila clavata]|uniref:Uncharacterized protein n=1 Tax=Trichonephila clavata TaxID=2740835 RepID=A0A8X6HGN6_TRICU|nr:hypothetical protein TNCT_362271 [Trichonephila clavata]